MSVQKLGSGVAVAMSKKNKMRGLMTSTGFFIPLDSDVGLYYARFGCRVSCIITLYFGNCLVPLSLYDFVVDK